MVNLYVTLHSLVLGDQLTTPPYWFREGYTQSAIKMVIDAKGSNSILTGAGVYCKLDAIGYTRYQIYEGDVVEDAKGNYWMIMGIKECTRGATLDHFEVDLKQLLTFVPPAIGTAFGFESITPGVEEFETGFERGTFTT